MTSLISLLIGIPLLVNLFASGLKENKAGLLLSVQGTRKISGGDASTGNTRSHTEHVACLLANMHG